MNDARNHDPERLKLSATVELGRVIVDLTRVIRTPRGLFESADAHRAYRDLRSEAIFAGNAQIGESPRVPESEVHLILLYRWPGALYYSWYDEDEIDWIEDRHRIGETIESNSSDEYSVWRAWLRNLDDRIEQLQREIDTVDESMDFVSVPLPSHLLEVVRQGRDVARRVESQKHDYLQALQGERASLISSFSVDAAENDFDFSFVRDERVRRALSERLQDTYQAFRTGLYGLSAVAGVRGHVESPPNGGLGSRRFPSCGTSRVT